ncbi:MAG: peptidase M15A [Halanaerobiales bacterium]|nr:peptidase M15A [Halanaerobiales bacterium]
MNKKIAIIIFILLLYPINSQAFNNGKVGFKVSYNNKDLISQEVASVFVLPGTTVDLNIYRPQKNNDYVVESKEINMIKVDDFEWQIRVPKEPGNYRFTITNNITKESIRLNIFVLEPFSNLSKGYLNDFRIGNYPFGLISNDENYDLPKGFVKVTPENEDTYLTPHFQLKQFICRQQGTYPKYIVLQELLLNKLEYLLFEINQKGFNVETFHIISGYRTPYYNQYLGNGNLSRHIFGDAADIIIDVYPKDGYMDDLNSDGKINYKDADILYDLVERVYKRREYGEFVGGLGLYKRTSKHSPFIHIDTRGYKVRW